MTCPWCQNKCTESKEPSHMRHECKCDMPLKGISFTCNTRKHDGHVLSFVLNKVLGGDRYLQLLYNSNPPQIKLYATTLYNRKPPLRLKVVDGLTTPEAAAHLVTKYSKLMAFI